MSSVSGDDYRMHAFRLGLQYLGAGRFAGASGFMPVAANLLHHAVEMFLKGTLVTVVGFENLPRGRNGHDLNELWTEFGKCFRDDALHRFDKLIQQLDQFEAIRYPEKLIKEGGLMSWSFAPDEGRPALTGPTMPEYFLSVDGIDELVHTLFGVAKVNPEFFAMHLRQEHAAPYFRLHNRNSLC